MKNPHVTNTRGAVAADFDKLRARQGNPSTRREIKPIWIGEARTFAPPGKTQTTDCRFPGQCGCRPFLPPETMVQDDRHSDLFFNGQMPIKKPFYRLRVYVQRSRLGIGLGLVQLNQLDHTVGGFREGVQNDIKILMILFQKFQTGIKAGVGCPR